VIALLPALLALLFALGCGGLESGAGGVAAAVGQAALLGSALAGGIGGTRWGDPWRLGRRWGWLPWGLVAAAAASWAVSPVPRAGAVGLLLLPAFVLLPGAVARALAGPRLERGAVALGLGAAAVALVSLADPSLVAGGRAARPFGHHLLLAGWLVACFPVPLMLLARRGAQRALGLASALAIGAAVLASRSLLGLSALALQALLAHRGTRRAWRLVLGVALLAAAMAVPRVERVLRGEDPSALARLDYLAAGGRGIVERPWLGWGPGATPWTVARFLAPGPGRRPAGEQVGDLHSLPAALAYELGLPGALLAAGAFGAFAAARIRERRRARDRRFLDGALLGLAGVGLVFLGHASLAVAALPVAAAVLAGLALAAGAASDQPEPVSPASGWGGRLAVAYAVAAAALLAPYARAHLAYDRARAAAEPEEARRELGRALQADPAFPLYRARRAWLEGTDGAAAARTAAEEGEAVAPLWFAAGVLAREAGLDWAGEALVRACRLDPLGPMAPFQLLLFDPGSPRAPALAARALAAEPRLAAARFWDGRPGLLAAAVALLERDERLERGWRAAFAAAARRPREERGRPLEIGLTYDGNAAAAPSLFLFRRRPWPAELGAVELRGSLVARFDLPAAAGLATTSPDFFAPAACGP